MELTIVGCSGSTSGPDSPASSYLVQAPYQGRTFSLVLDLGPGAFGALYRYLDPQEVDAIALTHLHPDHCLDVLAYYVAARYSTPAAPWPVRPLYGPAGTGPRLSAAYAVPAAPGQPVEAGPQLSESFEIHDWLPGQQIGPFDVRTARVAHPFVTYAVRLEQRDTGASLVFSGDTGPCRELVELARDVDLLLVEAAFLENPSNPEGLHLTGSQAAAAGSAAGVRAVVLTHIPPWHRPDDVLAEAGPYFHGPLTVATSGAHWSVG